jgi:hypothetical protein
MEVTMTKREEASARIDQWIAELNNPLRKQATSYLKTSDGGQCCLGVLCDIAGLKSQQEMAEGNYSYIGPVTGDGYVAYPPKCVAASVGLLKEGVLRAKGEHGEHKRLLLTPDLVAKYGVQTAGDFVQLNDVNRFTFPEIAQVIAFNKETMLEGVREDEPPSA